MEADGWFKSTWQRELSIKKGKRGSEYLLTAVHKVDYLRNNVTGEIVTSQVKGWNDTVRMAMLIDLILKPQAALRGGCLLVWMDNCSAHHVDMLTPIFQEANVEVAFLPPNTTYLLQVLDLVRKGSKQFSDTLQSIATLSRRGVSQGKKCHHGAPLSQH
jgi:hypothetical protein